MPDTTPIATLKGLNTIHLVPVKQLRESPFNPRKHYAQAALQELADSIEAQGMLQPIVARELPVAQQDIWVRYEIVFGHRRFRAAQLAGLDEVDVVIRPFTDEQAALAQVAENLQRQDVSQLEEADSFVRLHQVHGMTADQIAAGVNKSRSYVYGRLKLAKMAPEVRKAMADDGLPADIAIEVARIVDHTLQKKALKALKDRAYGEAWPSVRTAQGLLRGMYDNDVDAAPFDPADATLAKRAGPCTTCPNRAGNDPDLQGLVAAGVCTDTACFDVKTTEHFRIELAAMAAQGHHTLRGDAAAVFNNLHPQHPPTGYRTLDASEWMPGTDDRVNYGAMLEKLAQAGQDVPKPLAVHKRGWKALGQYLTDEQAAQVTADYIKLVGHVSEDDDVDTPSTAARAQSGGGFSLTNANVTDTTGWLPAERVVVDGDAWVRVKEAVLRNLSTRPRTADDMRVILLREFDQADGFGPITEVMGLDADLDAAEKAWDADATKADDFSYRAWWEAKLAALPPDTLAVMLLGASLWDLLGYGGRGYSRAHAAEKVALAERYGVDVVAASQPNQPDDAGHAGGPRAQAGADSAAAKQLDAFRPAAA